MLSTNELVKESEKIITDGLNECKTTVLIGLKPIIARLEDEQICEAIDYMSAMDNEEKQTCLAFMEKIIDEQPLKEVEEGEFKLWKKKTKYK